MKRLSGVVYAYRYLFKLSLSSVSYKTADETTTQLRLLFLLA